MVTVAYFLAINGPTLGQMAAALRRLAQFLRRLFGSTPGTTPTSNDDGSPTLDIQTELRRGMRDF